jgi:glycosyltransferase involved in cell wall biosynthesis
MTTATSAISTPSAPRERATHTPPIPTAAIPSASEEPRRITSVCIATINRPDGDTGVHTHTRMLASGLDAAGVRCDVVSAFDAGPLWLPVFAVRPLLLKRINSTASTLWHRKWHMTALRAALLSHVKTQPPDVIVAQCPVSARAALEMRDETGGKFPIVLVCHFNHSEAAEYREKGELAGEDRYRDMLAFEDRVLEEVDRIIYVSAWARGNVEETRGLRTKSSAVVWNGVDETVPPAMTRQQLGLSDGDLVLMNVGSLEPRKNQLGLLDLFATIHSQYPASRLVLIGDGPARGDVAQKIAEMNLQSAVTLLGHRRDVPALLPLADLYIHYAALENCPLALIEAARAGLAFAAVPAGGVPELQQALACKYELQPHDLRASMDNLRPLLDNTELRKAAGAQAQQKFKATFTRDAMTQAYINALAPKQ